MPSLKSNCRGSCLGLSVTQLWKNLKQFFSGIFSQPKPKQFTDFVAACMQDNKTPSAFHSCCEALFPCIKIGDNQLAQWDFLNKLTHNDSQKEAMKMWVSVNPWKDKLAMVEKLWFSSRGKWRHKTVRGGQGPQGQGGWERTKAGCQRSTQWKTWFKLVQIDFIWPLPESAGHKYILAVMDWASCYLIAVLSGQLKQ